MCMLYKNQRLRPCLSMQRIAHCFTVFFVFLKSYREKIIRRCFRNYTTIITILFYITDAKHLELNFTGFFSMNFQLHFTRCRKQPQTSRPNCMSGAVANFTNIYLNLLIYSFRRQLPTLDLDCFILSSHGNFVLPLILVSSGLPKVNIFASSPYIVTRPPALSYLLHDLSASPLAVFSSRLVNCPQDHSVKDEQFISSLFVLVRVSELRDKISQFFFFCEAQILQPISNVGRVAIFAATVSFISKELAVFNVVNSYWRHTLRFTCSDLALPIYVVFLAVFCWFCPQMWGFISFTFKPNIPR